MSAHCRGSGGRARSQAARPRVHLPRRWLSDSVRRPARGQARPPHSGRRVATGWHLTSGFASSPRRPTPMEMRGRPRVAAVLRAVERAAPTGRHPPGGRAALRSRWTRHVGQPPTGGTRLLHALERQRAGDKASDRTCGRPFRARLRRSRRCCARTAVQHARPGHRTAASARATVRFRTPRGAGALASRASVSRVDGGEMTLVRAGDGDLEVLDEGVGEPVLLIQTALLADELLPLAREVRMLSDYRTIAYHRRGYARSDPVTSLGSVSQDASHCRALLSALRLKRVHVVNLSYSSTIALQLAVDAPGVVQTLTLLEPPPVAVPAAEQFRAAKRPTARPRRPAGSGRRSERVHDHARRSRLVHDHGTWTTGIGTADAYRCPDVLRGGSARPSGFEVRGGRRPACPLSGGARRRYPQRAAVPPGPRARTDLVPTRRGRRHQRRQSLAGHDPPGGDRMGAAPVPPPPFSSRQVP